MVHTIYNNIVAVFVPVVCARSAENVLILILLAIR